MYSTYFEAIVIVSMQLTDNTMKYDDLIEQTGALGRFQALVFLIIGVYSFWCFPATAAPFIVFRVDHWCHVNEIQNLPKEQQRYIAAPYTENGEYDQCHR